MTDRAAPLRVGILGWGAIGRELGQAIAAANAGGDETLELVAVSSRFTNDPVHRLAVEPEQLGLRCDVVVEAAGPAPLAVNAERWLTDGADVIVVSIGALVDDALHRRLIAAGPGRLLLCAGAIGGLDLLAAAELYGPIDEVRLETTKPSATLVRDWMDQPMLDALRSGERPVECFRGSVADAVELFPESLNVSAALGLAAGDFDAVEVVVTGSPNAGGNSHDISIDAASGQYRVSVCNTPSPTNPRTSHITAWSVLRSLRSLAGRPGAFV
ncbi:MAG: aspartate dehydrogenase domain-containing protein [Acidimicrobiales bacterium]